MKYLIWLVVALAVIVWLKRLKSKVGTSAGQQQKQDAYTQTQAQERAQSGERMVQCAQCGIHFPASEAVTNASGTLFCSTEHRNLSS